MMMDNSEVLERLQGVWTLTSYVVESVVQDANEILELRFEGDQMTWPAIQGKAAVFHVEVEDTESPYTLRNTLIGFIDNGRFVDFPLKSKAGRMTFMIEGQELSIGYINGSFRKLTAEELKNMQGKRLMACRFTKN